MKGMARVMCCLRARAAEFDMQRFSITILVSGAKIDAQRLSFPFFFFSAIFVLAADFHTQPGLVLPFVPGRATGCGKGHHE